MAITALIGHPLHAHLAIIFNSVDTARVAEREITADGPDTVVRLRAAGLVPTRPRQRVLEVLDGLTAPVSAADVHGALRATGAGIGLTTVYRILHVLADNGLVHVLPGDEQRYRMCGKVPHTHLVCTSCGLVTEEPTEAARRWLRAREDFDVTSSTRSCTGCVDPTARTSAAVGRHVCRKRIRFP